MKSIVLHISIKFIKCTSLINTCLYKSEQHGNERNYGG